MVTPGPTTDTGNLHDPLDASTTTDPVAVHEVVDPLTSAGDTTSAPSEHAALLAESDKVLIEPEKKSIAELARAHTERQDAEHSALIDERGFGKRTGTQSGEALERAGEKLKRTDCTIYVLEVLGAAYGSAGKGTQWNKTLAEARSASGDAGLKGTEVLKALQKNMGWVGVFWAPDSQSSDAEHSYSAAKAKNSGSYYGIGVDHSVTDYRPEDSARDPQKEQLDKLAKADFGVLAARGGKHMALIVKGKVYEVHWNDTSDDHNLFEATSLDQWPWGSGVILLPPSEAKHFQ